ncbi:hypothetical protein MBLNU13_g00579t3 [Cladosporium sp. NU13]
MVMSSSSALPSSVTPPVSSVSDRFGTSSGAASSSQGVSSSPVSSPFTSPEVSPSASQSISAIQSLPESSSQTSADGSSPSSSDSVAPGEDSITTSLSPTYVSISTFVSEESPIPTCGAGTAAATVSSTGDSSVCQDPYGNTYNVTYGSKQYVGKVTKRAVTSNVNECLLLCNLESDCVAANYVGDECTLLSEVTGTIDVTTGPPAVAATRPPDPPVYGSSTTPGQSMSVTGSPGSSPAISTPMMTSSSSGVSSRNPSSSSAVNPPYGGSSSSSGVLPVPSSSLSASVPVGSPSLSMRTSGSSNPVSPPSQYTSPGGASSTQSSVGLPVSYSNPGASSASLSVPVSSATNGGVSRSSTGTVTSIRQSSASSNSNTSSRGMSISSGNSNPPGVSTSNSGPPIYDSSSVSPSLSNNPPPPYGQSTSSPAPSNNSPPPYGSVTSASSSSGNLPPTYGGSATVSPPTTSAVIPPAETLCPTYSNRNYTDSSGAVYTVYCGQDFAGTPFNPSYRRQATTYTIQSCMAVCDQYTACVAASTDGTSCKLFSSVTGTTGSPGTVAAYKVSGPTALVQTVTVCANKVTAYTTVWTTATHTTCPANSVCTVGPAYSNGFIGTARARR